MNQIAENHTSYRIKRGKTKRDYLRLLVFKFSQQRGLTGITDLKKWHASYLSVLILTK